MSRTAAVLVRIGPGIRPVLLVVYLVAIAAALVMGRPVIAIVLLPFAVLNAVVLARRYASR